MLSDLQTKPDVDKAKTILCAIVAAAGGKFEGKTRLNKAFWRAHVYHYQNNEGLLSKYPIARLPEGPAVDDLDDLLAALEREGRVSLSIQPHGDYEETVVELTSNTPGLDGDEAAAVAEAVQWVKGKTARRVSEESHRLSWGWRHGANGDVIDVQFDALDDAGAKTLEEQAARIGQSVHRATRDIQAIFGD